MMKKSFLRILSAILVAGTAFVASSCLSNGDVFDAYAQHTKDVAAIDSYLTTNNISAVKDPTGVRMVITQMGTGLPALLSQTITAKYTGKLFSNSATFDSGTADFALNQVIVGWQVAFSTLPKGSKATIYIPSQYAYGNASQGSIPPNSILVFDVEFIDVKITDTYKTQFTKDTTAINTYISSKSIQNVVKDASGLRYVITSGPTEGVTPSLYDKLKLKYTIKLLSNDTKTVATVDREPSDLFYSRVVDYIHGMKVGLRKMREGSTATLYIPSGLAFGTTDIKDATTGDVIIPANNSIIVEVQLIDIL